ncbi:MAG: response regulator [Leptolinea sp.]
MENKVILLVEDNADDEELTLRALKLNHVLNKVIVVHDGEEALEYLYGAGKSPAQFITDLPQVMLLDLKLPKLSGLDVLKQVRADPRTELLPVVILTSSNEDEDILSCYRSGANSYVRKPVEFERFADAVKQLGCYWLLVNQFPPIALSQSNQTEE